MLFIIRGIKVKIRDLSDRDRGTVENEVMKRLKTVKPAITKATRASALWNMILNASRRIAVSEAGKVTEEAGADTDSDKEITIQQPQTVPSSTLDTIVAILYQMKALTVLFRNHQTDID